MDLLSYPGLARLAEVSLLHANLNHFASATNESAATNGNPAFSALIWWLVPIIAVSGAIIYVIWVSRFKDKFENETNRSVTSFQSFQRTFNGARGAHSSVNPIPAAPEPGNPDEAG